MKKRTLVLPNDDGIRPAGKPDECFYCKQKVGTPHKHDCVMLCQKGKVELNIECIGWLPWSASRSSAYTLKYKYYAMADFLRSVADLIDQQCPYNAKVTIKRMYRGARRQQDVYKKVQ